eukprot:3829689-Pyramimonas_sp.AAC.2
MALVQRVHAIWPAGAIAVHVIAFPTGQSKLERFRRVRVQQLRSQSQTPAPRALPARSSDELGLDLLNVGPEEGLPSELASPMEATHEVAERHVGAEDLLLVQQDRPPPHPRNWEAVVLGVLDRRLDAVQVP